MDDDDFDHDSHARAAWENEGCDSELEDDVGAGDSIVPASDDECDVLPSDDQEALGAGDTLALPDSPALAAAAAEPAADAAPEARQPVQPAIVTIEIDDADDAESLVTPPKKGWHDEQASSEKLRMDAARERLK